MPNRLVICLFGPPGSGKTTAAAESGLTVFDRDDPKWQGVGRFADALTTLGTLRSARAVVLGTAPTAQLRADLARIVGATQTYLMPAVPRDELARRIHARGRHDERQTLAALDRWFVQFERSDAIPTFPGWPTVTGQQQLDLGLTS